ncbi:MAG: dephospho-CoA kinase [Clostridia bacterium]|nr:dephospho-CoA kinase [Clostridia bacterium]
MKIIGLTGPTGAGKGTAAAIFQKYGIPSVDTDAVYHELLERGGSMTHELATAFGSHILDENGIVDRKKLGATVFGHENTPELLHTLNTITHKYVMTVTRELLWEMEKSGVRAVLIDAPQLFEAKIEKECDIVVGVLADRDLRLSRIMARDGITRDAALRRINAQHDDTFYREACQYILKNDGDPDALEAQIRLFLEKSEVGL